MRYFFSADCHFGHENIIKFCNRPFKSAHDMEETLIKNWNSRVRPGDNVFHIGDFCYRSCKNFKNYASKLNGNIIYIAGNHDRNNGVRTPIDDIRIHYGGKELLLTHIPEEAGPGYDLVLCGHIHGLWKFHTVKFYEYYYDCVNVGVDVWGFRPVLIGEILAEYNRWKKGEIDSNGKVVI